MGTVTQYSYDGNGRRVMKAVCTSGTNPCTQAAAGSNVTAYVYDAQGELAAEYGPSTDGGTKYLYADALGSTRLVADGSGTVVKCLDYSPFGLELGSGMGGRSSCYGSAGYPGNPDTMDSEVYRQRTGCGDGPRLFRRKVYGERAGALD